MNNHNIGVNVGGRQMHMLAAHEGKFIEKKVPTRQNSTRAYIKEQLDSFIAALPFTITAVGMALPGLVDDGDVMPLSNVLPKLNGVEATYFSDGTYPVKFMNDVNAATLAVAIHHKDKHTVAVVIVDTGMAAGVTIEGKLLTGSQGFSGEVGWAHLPYVGRLERFDNIIAGEPILEKANCNTEQLLANIRAGDKKTTAIVEDAAYYFGICLGQIIQFYNPDIIVICGSVSTYPNYMNIAKATAQKATLPDMFKHTEIIEPHDPDRIVALWGHLNKDWD